MRIVTVSNSAHEMSRVTHSRSRIMTNPVGGDALVLVFKCSNCRSPPSRRIVHSYENIKFANNPNVVIATISSARFESQSRIIVSESERTLSYHMRIIILT